MNTEAMFSSKSNEWSTPPKLYEDLNKEFHFNLDPCSTDYNCKCEHHFTIKDDGLLQNWGGVQSIRKPTIWERN